MPSLGTLENPRGFAGFVLVASGLVLGAALLSQFWGGLAPCELCLLQRWPWDAAGVASLVMLLAGSRAALPWFAAGLVAVFALSCAFAFYHVGVEQHWFAGPTACTASGNAAMTLEDMKRQIMGTAPVMCDRVQWSLFGISLAGFNLLASFGMAAICLAVCLRTGRTVAPTAAGPRIRRGTA
ncbi:MAG TPA: disulfide bond formation protein B [Stellaceae bacterium]|jgi:disulfide bond formation protein DsbB|nr:disulfide bond formation protein B [Stellaceae bacterium]